VDWAGELGAGDLELRPGATEHEVRGAERMLSTAFSSELCALYEVTDGVFDAAGQWFVVWPLTAVVARNREARLDADLGSERRQLVGFGDDGTGAPYCVRRDGSPQVFVWSPIADEVVMLAPSPADFWRRRSTRSLPAY
jgi:hypothetical protein